MASPALAPATYNHILGGSVVEQNVNVGVEPERIERNYVQFELSFRIARFGTPRPRADSAGY